MTELIELRPLKTGKSRRAKPRSYTLTTAQPATDSSEDESSSDDESPIVLNLQSKPAKRKNKIQTLPVIINAQPAKEKKKHREKRIQQFVINTQPPSSPPKKQEIVFEPIIEGPLSHPAIKYLPVPAPTTSIATIVERPPYSYHQRVYTPTLVEERPYGYYNSYGPPVRRIVRRYPSKRSVHLPKHTKKLVNRFLSGMEYAHGRRYDDGSDSDYSIDDCRVCRRLRSAMDDGRRRGYTEIDLHRGARAVFDTYGPHTHKHGHSKNCRVCNLLENGDFAISTIKDNSKSNKKKRGKQVHIVESFPSRIKPVEQTTTTTTTQPNTIINTGMSYTTYVDPTTGLTYAYDPNWQYDPSGTGMPYDYSSYYTNPTYVQSNPQYQTYATAAPVVTDVSNLTTQQPNQQQTQTTTVINPNPLVDTGTYTYMQKDRKKRKPTNKTVVVHTARNPTPPAPKVIIEQPRLPRKITSTTVLKERSTQTPHRTTTTYIQT